MLAVAKQGGAGAPPWATRFFSPLFGGGQSDLFFFSFPGVGQHFSRWDGEETNLEPPGQKISSYAIECMVLRGRTGASHLRRSLLGCNHIGTGWNETFTVPCSVRLNNKVQTCSTFNWRKLICAASFQLSKSCSTIYFPSNSGILSFKCDFLVGCMSSFLGVAGLLCTMILPLVSCISSSTPTRG